MLTGREGTLRGILILARSILGLIALTAAARAWAEQPAVPLKAGIIGLDTSHAVAFTKILNNPKVRKVLENPRVGRIAGCTAYSPNKLLEPSHPDLFYYGVHGVETLFTIMGTGCKSVTRVHAKGAELAVGVWDDGRIGTFRGIRSGRGGFGATVFGTKGIVTIDDLEGYEPLVKEIARFFKTGKPPVSAEETLEIYAFMEAADRSKRQGGCPVSLEGVLENPAAMR